MAIGMEGKGSALNFEDLQVPRGSIVVHFWGSYLESYKVFRKRNYYGAYGYYEGCYKGYKKGAIGLFRLRAQG